MKLLEELVISNLPGGTTASWLRKFSSVQFKLVRNAPLKARCGRPYTNRSPHSSHTPTRPPRVFPRGRECDPSLGSARNFVPLRGDLALKLGCGRRRAVFYQFLLFKVRVGCRPFFEAPTSPNLSHRCSTSGLCQMVQQKTTPYFPQTTP